MCDSELDNVMWRHGSPDEFLVDNPEKLYLAKEWLHKVEELRKKKFSCLTDDERQVVALIFEGYKIIEIALALFGSDGKREQSRCSKIKERAFKKLHSQIEKDDLYNYFLD